MTGSATGVWCGSEFEDNCPIEWFYDDECDCGCDFLDPWCPTLDMQDCAAGLCEPSCDWCWRGTEFENNCPAEWCDDDEGCDCGCQFVDQDCGGPPCPVICNPECGDGVCDSECEEDCCNCPQDCGSCCGNGVCDSNCGEDCCRCPDDCGDCCGNGVCDCDEVYRSCSSDCDANLPLIVGTVPPNCAIDPRRSTIPGDTDPVGWDTIILGFDSVASAVLLSDFEVFEPGQAGSPICGMHQFNTMMSIQLCPRDTVKKWICLRYIPMDQLFCFGHLPGDVNGNRVSSMPDLSDLMACVNGDVQCSLWQCDIDRSGECLPQDILDVIDLFNGGANYEVYFNATISSCPNP